MAVIVYVSIFPQMLLDLCSYANFRASFSIIPLVQFYVHAQRPCPTPDHSSFWACGRGPLPIGCGCGGCGVGTRHQPHSAHSCVLALRVVAAA